MEALIAGARRVGLSLSANQAAQFEAYYQELVAWNRRMNLTAIIDYHEVQIKHFLDSLSVALAFDGKSPQRAIDIGTGAGFPGLPLKIYLPALHLTLVESTGKKARFLQHLIATLGLDRVEVQAVRAEVLGHRPAYREQFELVLSRAVASLCTLVELALPFARPGGYLVAQKKGQLSHEIEQAQRAMACLGGRWRENRMVELEKGEVRYLVIIDKVSPAPPLYPRRAGVPARRPL